MRFSKIYSVNIERHNTHPSDEKKLRFPCLRSKTKNGSCSLWMHYKFRSSSEFNFDKKFNKNNYKTSHYTF